jgi:iron complex transport system permease protein
MRILAVTRKRSLSHNNPIEWSEPLRRTFFLSGLAGLLIVAVIVSLTNGAVVIPSGEVVAILLHQIGLSAGLPNLEMDDQTSAIIMHIRLPRLLLAMLVGSALAVAGTVTQALFKNSLADSGVIGVQAGAALGAAMMIVLAHQFLAELPSVFEAYGVAAGGFLGGLVTTFVVFWLARRQNQTALTTLLLGGIAINAMVGAATGFLTYLADDNQLRSLTFWSMGSLGGATWESVRATAPLVLVAIFILAFSAKALNALCLGEAQAMHLGVNVERLKFMCIILIALVVGASVAAAGVIGFIGLVVPHSLRLLIGPDHRWILPGSALLGGVFLTLADVAARTSVAPAELPIGILTSLVGGPFFLWLLMREKQRRELW